MASLISSCHDESELGCHQLAPALSLITYEDRGLTGQDILAAGHISTELYTHMSRHGWKQVCAFCNSTVSANLGFLSLGHSYRHMLTYAAQRHSDVDKYFITATKCAGPFQVANKHFLLSHRHSSTDDGRSTVARFTRLITANHT